MTNVFNAVMPTNNASTCDSSPQIVPNDAAVGSSFGADTEIVDMLMSDTEDSGDLGVDDSQPDVDLAAEDLPAEDPSSEAPPATQERSPEVISHLTMTSQASGDVRPPTVRSRSSSMDTDSRSPSPEVEPPWFARFRHRSLTGLCYPSSEPRNYTDNSC